VTEKQQNKAKRKRTSKNTQQTNDYIYIYTSANWEHRKITAYKMPVYIGTPRTPIEPKSMSVCPSPKFFIFQKNKLKIIK